MNKYQLPMYLQLFNEDVEAGVNVVPAAEEQTTESTESNDKVDSAFAKRLSAAQEKWNSEKEKEIQALKDQFKDFDTYKYVAEYTQSANGFNDIMSTKEQIELAKLHERAEQENMSPDQLKRIEALEEKAARADELEAKQNESAKLAEFEKKLTEFATGKEIDGKALDHNELWKYMHENEVANPEIAYKAMKADALEAKLSTAKEDSIKEYLSSKGGVKTRGEGASAQLVPEQKKGFAGVEERLIAQLRANKEKI